MKILSGHMITCTENKN